MTMTTNRSLSIAADPYFPALRDHVIAATGMEFYASRSDALAGHLADRISGRGVADCHSYLELLEDPCDGEAELDRLIALLTIGETYFFRHKELFDALRERALPEVIRGNRATRRLRVWSAGCATGAEPYTVSILLRRELAGAVRDWNVSILGTDINRAFLARAAEGSYERWAFRGTPDELRSDCFRQQGASWEILPRFKENVSFQYHNLARHPFPSLVHNLLAFDLILCRNVLIYFAPDVAQRIISQLAECLAPGGWLAVGHAEYGLQRQESLEVVPFGGATLYRKAAAPHRAVEADAPQHRAMVFTPPRMAPPELVVSRPMSIAAPHCRPTQQPHGDSPPPAERRPARGAPARYEVEQIRTLADAGKVDAALGLCDALIARRPLDPLGHFYRALLLDQVAGHADALRALGRAIYLDRQFTLAHYYLGMTQIRLGDAAAARRSFRNVLALIQARDRSESFPDADGMSVADLEELTRMHLETLDAAAAGDPTPAESLPRHAAAAEDDRRAEIFRRRAEGLSRRGRKTASQTARTAILVVGAGGERFGFELSRVEQVFPRTPITPVPGADGLLVGVANLGGELRSVIDLGTLFQAPSPGTQAGYIVLVRAGERQLSLWVESLWGVQSADLEQLAVVDDAADEGKSGLVRGATDERIVVVHVEALMDRVAQRLQRTTRKP